MANVFVGRRGACGPPKCELLAPSCASTFDDASCLQSNQQTECEYGRHISARFRHRRDHFVVAVTEIELGSAATVPGEIKQTEVAALIGVEDQAIGSDPALLRIVTGPVIYGDCECIG